MNKQKQNYRIGLYIRVSTEEQAENPEGSIKNQEERLRETVRYKNREGGGFGEVVDVFIDRAKSGKDTNRPELQRMLSMIRNREINLVMSTELSRISRSIKDFADIWELMQKHQCGFLSLRENFDTTTAAGEMVLYSLANIAQFERRQTSERIAANFASRASRGLFNGGSLPAGYKPDPDKRGHLMIDKEQTEAVRMAFKVFLKEGSLSAACKWLNKNEYKLARSVGYGGRLRTGYFLIGSLHTMLRNKAYIGVRVYCAKGEIKEVKACWPAIIDEVTFSKVQKMLTKNHSRKKPHSKVRYPYLLSGITFCEKCGDRLSGKSAHGNGGKIPYYEHAWITKRNSTLLKPTFSCEPKRILATKFEPVVWSEVKKYLGSTEMAKSLFAEAQRHVSNLKKNSEPERIKNRLSLVNTQIEALTERLSQIPKTVSAQPIFKQMEKLEGTKQELEIKLSELKTLDSVQDRALVLDEFSSFAESLKRLLNNENGPLVKTQIIQKLVHKIEVSSEGIKIHFHVGKNHFMRELGSEASPPKTKKLLDHSSKDSFKDSGSNSLTNGGGGGS